jgi:hypothetical protein
MFRRTRFPSGRDGLDSSSSVSSVTFYIQGRRHNRPSEVARG